MNFIKIGILSVLLQLCVLCPAALAQFQGKTITIIVGFSPGGGYDSYARVLSRYFGRHVPGQPAVIVQNMPGASSLKAVEYLDTKAPKDGTVITAFNPGLITDSLVNPDKIKLQFKDLGWVGSVTLDERVCYAWAATGIKSFDDLKRAKQFNLGAPAPGTSSFISSEILKNVFKIPVHQVMGYPGSAEQRLAIERGELDGDCGSWSSIPADWISQKKINVLLRFSPNPIAGVPQDVPFIADLANDPETKSLLRMMITADVVGRPYVVSKQIPGDLLAVLRSAFDATVKDPDFVADMAKLTLPVVSPVNGQTAEQLIDSIYATSPSVVAKAKSIFAR